MSEGPTTSNVHGRTKSALSILRRSKSRTDETDSDQSSTNAAAATATLLALSPSAPALTPSLSRAPSSTVLSAMASYSTPAGQVPAATSTGSLTARASTQSLAAVRHGHTSSISSDRQLTIEQSVRKFRVFEALRQGDTVAISKAVQETSDADTRQPVSLDDTTILHLAIQCAQQPVIEYLLTQGAGAIDINARDRDGNTPLHLAVSQGRAPIVALLLLQQDLNDSIANYHGKLPLDLARTPEIFQQLQLSKSIFTDGKIKQIQELIRANDYVALSTVLQDEKVKTLLDINGGEFASDITTVQSGGTLLHEAARTRNAQLIQVLLTHGADPFRRDRKGKLPQDVAKDESTKALLKKSPAAVAAQRSIQEKAVLGNSASQGVNSSTPGDVLAGKESREMKGYLKKWTNYRKGYQLRWFVLEQGLLSYYKNQDDAGSACRGAINMRIAKLHMDPTEKTKFEIIGKSSVKYSLKANHEVEAKRWFWALNNSCQWTKDQAKEEEKTQAENAEMLRHAKAEMVGKQSASASVPTESANRHVGTPSMHLNAKTSNKAGSRSVAFRPSSTADSVADDDNDTAYGSYEPSYAGDAAYKSRNRTSLTPGEVHDHDDEDDEHSEEVPAMSKDAFEITAQSVKLQLEMMASVHNALLLEQRKKPDMTLADMTDVVSVFDGSIRSLKGLVGDMIKISKDRDSYWQQRLEREQAMRRIWEESMAKVAAEHEMLEASLGESEVKRKRTKKALREMINSSRPESRDELNLEDAVQGIPVAQDGTALRRPSTTGSSQRKLSVMEHLQDLSDDESDDEEFFDAADAGEAEVIPFETVLSPPIAAKSPVLVEEPKELSFDANNTTNLAPSYKGYEDGIRHRLKMDADDRPKISLWGILKSMIGKDMTKMTLPVSFNEPTSLLQRSAEDMEYADLLDIAADRQDSIERLVYIVAFAASEYASTIGRVAKPFNPLLGETFEYVRPDKQYRFFMEQVSHHPPIGAAWAESSRWTYYGQSAVQSKFYGKSFDINPLGSWFLKMRPSNGGPEEFYSWKKVTTSVIGIITGNPTVDNYGTMEVKNWTTGEKAIIEFKPRGWTQASAYQIAGRVNDASGKTRFSMGGHWNSKIYARLTPGYEQAIHAPKADARAGNRGSISNPDQVFLVWEANPRPTGIPFNLTPFCVTLNDLPDRLKPWLAPTDARFRPDQRAMEDGLYDLAATEKNRLEEKQRSARKKREIDGEEYHPVWFELVKCTITGEEYWQFNEQYWRERQKEGGEKWKMAPDIF